MAAQLGGQQISALLESLPGIASVLRSPVADAIVNMIRAGAGLGDFRESDANELVQYAVRRGLLGSEEGEGLLAEIKEAAKRPRARTATKKSVRTAKAKRVVKKKAAVKKTPAAKKATKTVKKTTVAKRATKRAKKKR
jgi:polyhydroxyalkanoate synthesis regulator phasin